LSGLRAPDISLTRLLADYSTSTRLTPSYSESTLFNFLLIPCLQEAPEPRGKPIMLRVFVDSDHAGDKVTRRSRTGYIIYMNGAPIDWFSKKQNTIESSSFGSEFVALKTVMEKLRGLRYKLRMVGFEIDGPTYMRSETTCP
jgi:hypothetical protein